MRKVQINNATAVNYRVVDGLRLGDITGNGEQEQLHGLLVTGDEMKWDAVNENGEEFKRGCMDKFMSRYYESHELNVPIDVQHDGRPEWLVGRVLTCEDSESGFKVVGYVPDTLPNYKAVKAMIECGVLQGFSKCGFATDYEWADDGHMVVKEFMLLSMSLVSTPANSLKFDDVELKDTTAFKHVAKKNTMEELFNC